MNLRFLTASARIDADGYHVWITHECLDGIDDSMLPYPMWRSGGRTVTPSVNCLKCGLHSFVAIDAALPLAAQPEGK